MGRHVLTKDREGQFGFDFFNIRGQRFVTDEPFCFGSTRGSVCEAPPTDTEGSLKLNFSESSLSVLTRKMSSQNTHHIDLTVTGDDNESDCQQSGLKLKVRTTYGVVQ